MNNSILKSTAFCFLALFICTSFEKDNIDRSITTTDPRIEVLLSRMTLEEKIGQMTQINITQIMTDSIVRNYDSVTTFVLDTNKLIDYISTYHVGSFLNGRGVSAETWYQYMDKLQKINQRYSRNKIPIIYGVDHVHGSSYLNGGTIFPHNINIASTFDTAFAYQAGQVTVYETADLGHRWIFAPVLDVGRNKYWGRYYETYGEDSYLTSKMGASFIRGIQDERSSAPYKVAACAKHFIGYSDPKSGWDRSPAEISDQTLREFYLPSFRAAVIAGVKTMMINSGEVNGIPVHASYELLTDLLRKELGFEGIAVTDWLDIIALQKMHHVAENEKEATYMAIKAGIDMSMTPLTTDFCRYLKELVQEGRISEDRINISVRRILKVKFDIGLFENPYPRNDRFSRIGDPENKLKALNAARESIVLLKNSGTLPLSGKGQYILLAGPNADRKVPLCGGWTYRFMARSDYWFPKNMLTLYDGIKNEFKKSTIMLADESDLKSKASAADIIILAMGEENAYAETDGSINDLELPDEQIKLAEIALATGKPVVLVLLEGRPRTINRIFDRCHAVVFAGLPGTEGAQAIAEILSGKMNPCGKLSFTYPYKQGHIISYNHKPSEYSPLRKVKGELNRYAIASFGEGLSYSDFQYSGLILSDTILKGNNELKCMITVKNRSKLAGKESVLWFVTDEAGSITRPVAELKYFEKRFLKSGESYTFNFIINPSEHLSFPDKNGKVLLEDGYFMITAGGERKRFYYKQK
jgi:beta-glucosidase